MQFFATTAKAMEPLLRGELEELGARNTKESRAGVSFEGDLEVAYRACLWSRIANRILLPLKTFPAPDEKKLYAGVKSIRWSDHLGPENTLAVDFATSDSAISHSKFGALKTKDAIVDQIRSNTGERPSIDVSRPDVRVNVYLYKNEATVSVDLSGDSLHLRGYREEGAGAPLKENLAAAILMHAGWKEAAARGEAFVDPMCGSGTLPIEAAMMAADIAPGLERKYYGFLRWKGHRAEVWKKLVEEAFEREGVERKTPKIVGYDQDAKAIRVALANLERAGLVGRVHFEKREFSRLEPTAEKGLVVINPPYGERLGEIEELRPLYKRMGDTFKQKFKGWDGYIFTGSPELSKAIGLKASRRIVLFNGPIECRLFKYELY